MRTLDRFSVSKCDNGWLLGYWAMHDREMVEHNEIYTEFADLQDRARLLFGPVSSQPAPELSPATAALIERELAEDEDYPLGSPPEYPNPVTQDTGD